MLLETISFDKLCSSILGIWVFSLSIKFRRFIFRSRSSLSSGEMSLSPLLQRCGILLNLVHGLTRSGGNGGRYCWGVHGCCC